MLPLTDVGIMDGAWRVRGDMPVLDALGEWPEVYEAPLDGGVTAGEPPLCEECDMAVMGEGRWAAETAAAAELAP